MVSVLEKNYSCPWHGEGISESNFPLVSTIFLVCCCFFFSWSFWSFCFVQAPNPKNSKKMIQKYHVKLRDITVAILGRDHVSLNDKLSDRRGSIYPIRRDSKNIFYLHTMQQQLLFPKSCSIEKKLPPPKIGILPAALYF